MNTDLQTAKAALAGMTDAELRALIDATRGVPQIAPGLLAWIDGTCEWELNRRAGHEYELLPPEAAIDSSEDAVSIDAAIAMRARFAQDSSAVRAMFDALVALLTGGGREGVAAETGTDAEVATEVEGVPAFEQPDRERVYRNYLETCRRLGVKPTPQGRAEALIKEWTKALAAGRIDPPEAQ